MVEATLQTAGSFRSSMIKNYDENFYFILRLMFVLFIESSLVYHKCCINFKENVPLFS